MALIDRWRRKLESKYQVVVNAHDDPTARGGEKSGDGEERSFSGFRSGLQKKPSCGVFVGQIPLFSRCCRFFSFDRNDEFESRLGRYHVSESHRKAVSSGV